MVSYPFQMVQGLLIFSFTFMQILDVIWPMTRRHTLCGICSQSHGVARFRLNLEAFQMSADKVVETIGSTTKLQAVLALDASVCRGLMDPHKQSEVQEVHV